MKDNYESSLAIILREEGGNDDDPRDPGGRTSRGIIQREWNVYRQSHPDRPDDVWKASDDDVAAIYRTQYWDPYCDNIPSGVDLIFFNTSVNSGRQQAVKELQRALGVTADGMMGMITFNALNAESDIPALIHDICELRRNFYRHLKTFSVFGKGWLARTDRIEKSALKMAGLVHPEHPPVVASKKAPPTEKSTTTVSPEASGSATAGLGSLIAMIDQIKHELSQFTGTFQSIQYVLLALTVIGIGYTIYSVIHKNNVQQAIG